MDDIFEERGRLLSAARDRGHMVIDGQLLPGLDNFTVYTGLISKALDLAKLLATEERDLRVIHTSYDIEVRVISSAFQEVELAMAADFDRDSSLRDKTFEAINQLIAAGQYEIASEFHKRLIANFQRPALETIIEQRNQRSGATSLKLNLR